MYFYPAVLDDGPGGRCDFTDFSNHITSNITASVGQITSVTNQLGSFLSLSICYIIDSTIGVLVMVQSAV